MNDLIRLAAERAAQRFGDNGEGLFSAANFALAFADIAGVNGTIDGKIVRAMLTGRQDVQVLQGSHYRLVVMRTTRSDTKAENVNSKLLNALQECRDAIAADAAQGDVRVNRKGQCWTERAHFLAEIDTIISFNTSSARS